MTEIKQILTRQKEQKRRIIQSRSALQRRKPPRRSTVRFNQLLRILQILLPTVHASILLLLLILLFPTLLSHHRTISFSALRRRRRRRNPIRRHGEARSRTRDPAGARFSSRPAEERGGEEACSGGRHGGGRFERE